MAANVQSMVQYWKNFDLPQLQRELDLAATELANRQDESESSRKKLVELSREFKKTTAEDIRKVVAPLLKCFQLEIDALSKRSKAAEAAFLNVYKRLVDLPDPMPVLEYCLATQHKVQRLYDLDMENRQLRETLHDYNQELKEVKNQEVTIKQLKEKIKEYEDRLDTAVMIRTQEKEQELERHFANQERHLHESHRMVAKKLGDTEQHVTSLQSALESSQSELFDLRSKYDEESHAKSEEMEMIVNDLERANQRAALAEKEVVQLKEQLVAATHSLQLADRIQKAPDMEQTIDILTRSSLEVELAAKEKEESDLLTLKNMQISQLVDDVQRLQSTINKMKETANAQIARLEDALEEKNRMVQQLEKKLDGQKDYEDVKRELGILKCMEFPSGDGSTKTLEVLLVEKTKALQAENTALKVTNADVTGPPPLLGLPAAPFPPPLQTVETFGSLLGEEIVTSWQRTMSPPDNENATSLANGIASGIASEDADEVASGTVSPNTAVANAVAAVANASVAPMAVAAAAAAALAAEEVTTTKPPPPPTSCASSPPPPVVLSNGVLSHDAPIKEEPPKDVVESATLGQLQDMLRHNIDKYANDCLNTLNISRRVRELLSIHNIGQRLFAKYILGLSQGTVSELLSKPKPWDKLTEKGRDSYRKMHAWACDENCIYMLKALVPKKGKDPGLPSFRQDDAATEERIAIILNEAQIAMKTQLMPGVDDRSNDSTKVEYLKDPSGMQRRIRKYENDDIPQEMVTKIYQEELAKLMGKSPKELSMLGPSLDFPKDQYLRTQEEIRLALSVYHQELTKLTQHHHMILQNGVQDLSLPKDRRHDGGNNVSDNGMELERPHSGSREGFCESPQFHAADNLRHAGSAFTLVRPKQEPPSEDAARRCLCSSRGAGSSGGGGGEPCCTGRAECTTSPNPLMPLPEDSPVVCTAASPLQRMQSITNSLISQPTMPSLPTPPQRPLKAVLPPITQQQFDQYTNLNTEDIVKKVKEQLSQFSISQRLFGESVLGLSQGSVSDLLARPKPWHMLTQKGREPFIRMKIFLEDENAVHKLVASQYKIAPEKLMRTGSYGPSPPIINSSKSHHPPKEMEAMKPVNPTPGVHPITVNQVHLPPSTPEMARAPTPESVLRKGMGPRAMAHLQPSVYEMAALTQDLDTQLITTRIKETLLANNIGQKIFGEAVLGLSQGSVSELLSKPKPWHMLSIKGREPFIRMQLWLNDPHNVDRLQALKNERREANKRRRNNVEYGDGSECGVEGPFVSGASTPLGQSPIGPAPKKPRVLFSEEQKEALRLAFALDPYPGTATIEFLAQELRLTARTITNWFHNHRMRLKQQAPHSGRADEAGVPTGGVGAAGTAAAAPPNGREGSAPTFDPVQFRLLLNQRLLELQKEKGNALGPLAGFPFYDDGSVQMSGLDLSLSSASGVHHQGIKHEYEMDSNGSSDYNEDDSDSSSKDLSAGCEPLDVTTEARGKSSSRRKPAVPQWVNPGWSELEEEHSDTDEEAKECSKSAVIINGVCVRQTEDFDLPCATEETVRVEPAPAPDHELLGTRGDTEMLKAEGGEEDAAKGADNERLVNIERLEKSLHEHEEGWEMMEEDRQSNIEKLQQRIEKCEDEEDWEF